MTDHNPRVQGQCPACGWRSLFLGDGGHLTCSSLDCPLPDTMLAFKVRESGMPFYRRGDKLPSGEEFVGYTDDGTTIWKEPLPPIPQTIALDDYEVANLREGLLTLRALGCDTGDWLGQILNKLPVSKTAPNFGVSEQARRVWAFARLRNTPDGG